MRHPEAAPPITVPMVLFKIGKTWREELSDAEVHEITRGWWRKPKKMVRAEYAAGVAGGVIRGVYRIDAWRERVPGDRDWTDDVGKAPRIGFCGAEAAELAHLVGLSVRHLHVRGNAAGAVCLNCADDALPEKQVFRGDDARTMAESEGVVVLDGPVGERPGPPSADAAGLTSTDLRAAVATLAASPLHALSLSSHELFFSNLIAWVTETFPEQIDEVLAPWLVEDAGRSVHRVRPEWHHLDVVLDLTGRQTLVLENKTLSMPDVAQLARYDQTIADEAGGELSPDPSKVLFSPVDPGWTDDVFQASDVGRPWSWLSFEVLADRIEAVTWPRAGSYEHLTVKEFVVLLRALSGVLNTRAARPTLDDPLDLAAEDRDILLGVRLHHLVAKARVRHVGRLVEARLRAEGLGDDLVTDTNLSKSQTLLDGLLRVGGTLTTARQHDRRQWQIQGGQLRLALVLPSRAGTSGADIAARVAVAEQDDDWFDFQPARDVLGARCGRETGRWLRFNPDFVYRNVAITAPTVRDAVELGVAYSRRLVELGDFPQLA